MTFLDTLINKIDFTDKNLLFRMREYFHSGSSFSVGKTTFKPVPADFEGLVKGEPPLPNIETYGLLCTMRSRRFTAAANFHDFGSGNYWPSGAISIPTLYLFTSDERKGASVDAAGGSDEIALFKNVNGSDHETPVIIFLENNGTLVEAEQIDEALIRKLNFALFPRLLHGQPNHLVKGSSFSQIIPLKENRTLETEIPRF